MRWLKGGFQNLQLDIVGFLAILGEASIKANAQVSALSHLSLLPRLLPAPQALIRTSRPTELKPDNGNVIGDRSGGIRDKINHIAHLLHSRDPLPAYHVRCQTITKPVVNAEVTTAAFGPLSWLAVLGTFMSISLLGLAISRSDGFALIANILLSFLSSLIGYGSRWKLELMKRRSDRQLPMDSIVIKYPQGAFLIINCDEDIARELYWHPEECKYKVGDLAYRAVSLVGTITLMFGVICLANATLELQIAFAAAYMILNAAYWVGAALPPQWHWDLSCYHVETEEFGEEKQNNFTQALWKAIAITQSIDWVKNGQVAPVSEGWKKWVNKAGDVVWEEKLREEAVAKANRARELEWAMPDWDADQALTDFLKIDEKGSNV